MALKHHIPNALTLCNLLCGCLAIAETVTSPFSNLVIAQYLIIAGASFDVLDGLAARILKVKSEIGVQLDSLADMITFGLAPAIILYEYIGFMSFWLGVENEDIFSKATVFFLFSSPFLLVLASAIRLAKFNVGKAGTDSHFIGLPTPAMALIMIGVPNIIHQSGEFIFYSWLDIALPVTIIVVAYLMLSHIPFISLKLKAFEFATHWPHLLLLVATAVWVLWLGWGAGLPFLGTYLVCSLLAARVEKNQQKRAVQG
jgi:CDP-diacylglycerol---serine O-phosphatidyltransferase